MKVRQLVEAKSNLALVRKLTPSDTGYTIKPVSKAPEGEYTVYNAKTNEFVADELDRRSLLALMKNLKFPAIAVPEDGPSGVAYA